MQLEVVEELACGDCKCIDRVAHAFPLPGEPRHMALLPCLQMPARGRGGRGHHACLPANTAPMPGRLPPSLLGGWNWWTGDSAFPSPSYAAWHGGGTHGAGTTTYSLHRKQCDIFNLCLSLGWAGGGDRRTVSVGAGRKEEEKGNDCLLHVAGIFRCAPTCLPPSPLSLPTICLSLIPPLYIIT